MTNSTTSHSERRETCPGCGNEIDPDCCGCGSPMDGHTMLDGHSPVPMGCDCMRDSGNEKHELRRTVQQETK